MATSRKSLLDLANPGWVHCISRCVRRAYLAGGTYDHRRDWVEGRLLLLAEVFACEVAAYAVMSNHVHVVVRMAPEQVSAWSDTEVVRRWWRIYPGAGRRLADGSALDPTPDMVAAQARDRGWVAQRRRQLADLPEFMKALKQHIARRANAEDGCTGAFWEERYTSVPLLDQAALIACMAYVDLNPVRATTADRPERSIHTSVRERVRARQRHRAVVRAQAMAPARRAQVLRAAGVAAVAVAPDGPESGLWVAPLARCTVGEPLAQQRMSAEDYLKLVDATGRVLRAGKRGVIPPELAPILARLDLSLEDWLATFAGWRSMLGGALGHAASRAAEAARRGTRWVRNRCPLFAVSVSCAA